ncbi:MAG: ATP-binding protein [Gemmatimonadetes bacterium]|nr:ATP-binding protein [Gemmatimonadota bacterium]
MSDAGRDRRVERERAARKTAETLLEEKSRELFLAIRELEESRDHLDRILASMLNALIVTDVEGNIESMNTAARSLLGYEVEELEGRPLVELFPEDCVLRSEGIERLFETREARRGETTCTSRRDGTLQVQYSASVLETHDHEPRGIVCVLQDVSEQRSLERQLWRAQKLESIGQLAAGVAHEINTPIQYVGDNTRFVQQSVSDLTTLLAEYGRLVEKAKCGEALEEAIARIQQVAESVDVEFMLAELPVALEQSIEGVDRVAEIVGAMKQFSHPGSEEKTAVDLNEAVESSVTVARNEWKRVAEVTLDLAEDLPFVPALPGDLHQVILHVVVNAAHAIGEKNGDGEQGSIAVATRRSGDFAEIRIRDTGCGMSDSVKNRIFDPFFTTKPVGTGTGQGLAVSHDVIVNKHGGTIDVETVDGQGTTFIIRLPLDATVDASERPAA